MGTIVKPNTFTNNTTASATEVNANFDTIYNEFNGDIDSNNLADSGVTTAKIADSNVTTAKINDSAVTTAKINDDAVTSAKLVGLDRSNLTTDSNPYKFLVYRNAAANTGNGAFAKVTFDTEVYDTNSNFASGTYTAPVAGFYQFSWMVQTGAATTEVATSLYLNGATYIWGQDMFSRGGSSGTVVLSLAANDTIEIYCYGNTAIALLVGTGPMKTYFSGCLISRT